MSFNELEVGDIVVHQHVRWRVTDVYERSPIRQRQASLQILDEVEEGHPVTLTGVPVYELMTKWRL